MSSVKYLLRKALERTTWVTLIFFAIFGLLFVSLILHEYSHQRDLEGLTTSSFTCLLVMPESIGEAFNPLKPTGYYAYNVDYSNAESYEKVKLTQKYTELKAYAINFAVILIVCFAIAYQFGERRFGRK